MLAPHSVLGLVLHITASAAATDSPVRVYLSASSKSTKVEQVDVVIPSVGPFQLKVYNFAIEFACVVQNSESRVVELFFKSCVECSYEWQLRNNSYTRMIKVNALTNHRFLLH